MTKAKQIYLLTFLAALIFQNANFAQSANSASSSKSRPSIDTFKDGPYIFIKNDTLDYKWVHNGKLIEKSYLLSELQKAKAPDDVYFPKDHPGLINGKFKTSKTHFKKVDRFVAISDLHGQYDTAIQLLRSNKVIDDSNNWIYGDGHLILLGDIFDRGDQVTEICWFFYELEKKAEQQGGKVHIVIGNHELMTFNGDLRYLNKNYLYTSALLRTSYNDLYGKNTILGAWLRSKPIAISINDIVFVHAGFSEYVLDLDISFKQITKLFQGKIYDKPTEEITADPLLTLLYANYGPLWYRGYFDDPEFTEEKAKELIKKSGYKHIVVGHTSMSKIESYFENQIICIDSSIKEGDKGEVLIYEKGNFSRGLLDGKRLKLFE